MNIEARLPPRSYAPKASPLTAAVNYIYDFAGQFLAHMTPAIAQSTVILLPLQPPTTLKRHDSRPNNTDHSRLQVASTNIMRTRPLDDMMR